MWEKSVRVRRVWFCLERKWVDSRNTGWYYHMKKNKFLSPNNNHVRQADPLWFRLSGKTISRLLRDSPQLQHLIYGDWRPRPYQTVQAPLPAWDVKPLSSDVLRHVTTLSNWMIHRQENGNGSRLRASRNVAIWIPSSTFNSFKGVKKILQAVIYTHLKDLNHQKC